jgi:hypothetical protein
VPRRAQRTRRGRCARIKRLAFAIDSPPRIYTLPGHFSITGGAANATRGVECYVELRMSDDSREARPGLASADARDRAMLEKLQGETFTYFERHANPRNGLIADSSEPGSPASIAAVGLGLSAYVVAVERGLMARETVIARTLAVLRFFHASPQGTDRDATGYKGFYYHFLDMETGRRAWHCELSTIDTALLLAGVVTVGRYFDGVANDEVEIRELADAIYRRVDWTWACNASGMIGHGWTPERGRLRWAWDRGYSEALILHVLALGSPTFPISAETYGRWTSTFERKTLYGFDCLYAGPMFIHQLSHVWLDFRGIRDERNRAVGFDYFENSRRATLVQRQYAVENPNGFAHYSEFGWGLTASDGPGPSVRTIDGVRREFFGYVARGAPFGPDDGTLSPWAVVASVPFAPRAVCDTIHHAIESLARRHRTGTGFDASYNSTFSAPGARGGGWVSPWKLGLNEGPIVLMIENHLSELLWKLFCSSPYAVRGLRRAGFDGGWLDAIA